MKRLLPFLLIVSTAQAQTRAGLIDFYERLTTISEGSTKQTTVVLLGDSHMEGVINKSPSDPLADNYGWKHSNLLRRDLLQSVYPGPLGGVGFVPMADSAGSPVLGPGGYTGGEQVGSWQDFRFNTHPTIQGVCLKYTQTSQTGAYKRWSATSGSLSNPEKNFGGTVNAYQFVYQKFPGAGILEVSLTSWGGGVVYDRQVVDCNAQNPSYGNLTPAIRNPGGAVWVKIQNISSAPIRVEGAFLYSGDETGRLRMANYACGGSTAAAYNNQNVIDGALQVNPDVVGLWWGHNDVLGGRYTVAQWAENTRGIIRKIQYRLPKVSIFLIHGWYFQPSEKAVWDQMQAELESICSEFRVALLSLHEKAGFQRAADWAVPNGYIESNKAHMNRTGQSWLSGQILSLLNRKVVVG